MSPDSSVTGFFTASSVKTCRHEKPNRAEKHWPNRANRPIEPRTQSRWPTTPVIRYCTRQAGKKTKQRALHQLRLAVSFQQRTAHHAHKRVSRFHQVEFLTVERLLSLRCCTATSEAPPRTRSRESPIREVFRPKPSSFLYEALCTCLSGLPESPLPGSHPLGLGVTQGP